MIWDRHAIRAAVYRRGLTLVGIARAAGLESSSCSVALCRRHRAGEAALAEALGVEPSTLWPDRYPDSGVSQIQRSRKARRRASPNGAALLTRRAS